MTKWWNRYIKLECDFQDQDALYRDAWDSNMTTILQFHSMISIHHTDILEEVRAIMPNEMPESKCDYIWLRYFHDCPSIMDKLPTLYSIISKYTNIPVLGLVLQYPGYQGQDRNGTSRAVYRYYYGLQVPPGSEDILIQDTSIRCEEVQGLVWDNTNTIRESNKTKNIKIVILAEVLREFNGVKGLGTYMIYNSLSKNKKIYETWTKICLPKRYEYSLIHNVTGSL